MLTACVFKPVQKSERLCIGLLSVIVVVQLATIGMYPILDKSEARYALIVLRMVETGNWVTPSIDGVQPFWGKPPLGFWLAALSAKAFGLNEFSVRLPSLLANLATTYLIADFGCRIRDATFGLTAGVIFASMGLVFVLSGQVIIDPPLALGVTLTMVAFWRVMTTGNWVAGHVVFIGLAISVMTKGLIGIVFTCGACFIWALLQKRAFEAICRLPIVTGSMLLLGLVLPWYTLAEMRTPGFLNYFIVGEHFRRFLEPGWTGDLYGAGRKQIPGAIWLFLLVGTLPWSGVMISALAQRAKRVRLISRGMLSDPCFRFLAVWALVPLVFYSLTRNLVLYYTLPVLPPLALLMAQALRNSGDAVRRWTVPGSALAMPVLGIVLVAIANAKPDARFLPSQSQTVTSWREMRDAADDTLVYLFNLPFSASFYAGDQVRLASDTTVMTTTTAQRFFAVSEWSIEKIPSHVLTRFEKVGQGNGTVLLRRIGTKPAPTSL